MVALLMHVEEPLGLGDECLDFRPQARHLIVDDLPHLPVVGVVLLVSEDVSEADDAAVVRYPGGGRRIGALDAKKGLADNLETPLNRQAQARVTQIARRGRTSRPGLDVRAGRENILKPLRRLRMHRR